jgi:hypothetical protein
VTLEKDQLRSPSQKWSLHPRVLYTALRERTLCPAVFLSFFSLSFLNSFNCLGSFEQVEYLSDFKTKLMEINWPKNAALKETKVISLTTGRAQDVQNRSVYPLDMALGSKLEIDYQRLSFGDWVQPLIPRWFQSTQ